MSKYTTELRFICENSAGLTESVGYSGIDEVLDKARDIRQILLEPGKLRRIAAEKFIVFFDAAAVLFLCRFFYELDLIFFVF